jgi:lysophospholipase L1-like esterase
VIRLVSAALACSLVFIALPGQAHQAPVESAACLVMGDSIAQGAGTYAPKCAVLAVQGITSQAWARRFREKAQRFSGAMRVVLISLGSNDGDLPDPSGLIQARASVQGAARVIWMAPGPQFPARAQVLKLARYYGDEVYERPIEQLLADGVHFSSVGYKRIASLLGMD